VRRRAPIDNVGTDTPKLCAASCGGVPLANQEAKLASARATLNMSWRDMRVFHIYSDHQHQLIREIRSRLPLPSYSNEHLIKEFHEFEADLVRLTRERAMKFFVDLTKER
jgi:hypothetical protein